MFAHKIILLHTQNISTPTPRFGVKVQDAQPPMPMTITEFQLRKKEIKTSY